MADTQNSEIVSRTPLEAMYYRLEESGLADRETFVANVSMPYHGELSKIGSYIILGTSKEILATQTPQLRGTQTLEWGPSDEVRINFSQFYAKDENGTRNLEAVGMPRRRNGEDDYRISEALDQVSEFGVRLDAVNKRIGIAAVRLDGDNFIEWVSAPDRYRILYEGARLTPADYAVKMGFVATMIASRKASKSTA